MNLKINEPHTGEYQPQVAAVQSECTGACTKKAEGQYSPAQLIEQARSVSKTKKYTGYDFFHRNGLYAISNFLTKKEPFRILKLPQDYYAMYLDSLLISLKMCDKCINHNYISTTKFWIISSGQDKITR